MHSRAPRAGVQAALLTALVGLIGCAPSPFKINVQSVATMNQNRPLYMVVRNVDQKTFLTESYQTVASQVITPDPSVVQSEVVFPGSKREIEIPTQTKTPVAIYFLFTAPASGQSWKILIDQPLPDRVDLQLGIDGIQGLNGKATLRATGAAGPATAAGTKAKAPAPSKLP